jgi:multidrug efflux pump subunit AcrA (membrane-fusion protein)
MFARVRIITDRKDNIVKIPASAVIHRFGEQFVFVVDSSEPENLTVQRRAILPGILIDGMLEIQQGLSPYEELVVRGQTLLENGSRVNLIERVSPLPN